MRDRHENERTEQETDRELAAARRDCHGPFKRLDCPDCLATNIYLKLLTAVEDFDNA